MIRNVPFKFVDVGGHRSQRQMWYRCFDVMRSILFFAASNEFDQFVSDEQRQNRLVESMDIFELICNNKALVNVSVILFLNKTDLLAEKIVNSSIADYFPVFSGNPHSLTDVQQFEISLFDHRRKDRSQLLYHHFTTAVDTENCLMVFRDVRDTILQQNIRSLLPSWMTTAFFCLTCALKCYETFVYILFANCVMFRIVYIECEQDIVIMISNVATCVPEMILFCACWVIVCEPCYSLELSSLFVLFLCDIPLFQTDLCRCLWHSVSCGLHTAGTRHRWHSFCISQFEIDVL